MEKSIKSIGAYKIERKSKGSSRVKNIVFVIFGGISGALTGMLGGGGGSLIVPLYQSRGLESRQAHASAIATILPLSIISGGIYLAQGGFSLATTLYITLGVVVGGALGSTLLKRINLTLLSVAFYGIMIYAGIKTLLA